jgi:GntR family transcriptional repressor for pyruvate dehydrogenase complex
MPTARAAQVRPASKAKVPAMEVSASPWQRLSQGSLSENIIAQVRDALFSGRLKSGDYLGTETSLAESFGVSRVAIRDAIRSLHANGVIESRKGAGGGIRIAQGDPDRFADALAIQLKLIGVSIREIIDAHFTIETAAAELASKYATEADLGRLQTLLSLVRKSVKDADMRSYIDNLLSFHLALAQASHNRALSAQLKGYFDVLESFYRGRATPEKGRRVIGLCAKVLEAIKDRDRERTRTHMVELFRPLGEVP